MWWIDDGILATAIGLVYMQLASMLVLCVQPHISTVPGDIREISSERTSFD
jgi:hypothetical protein